MCSRFYGPDIAKDFREFAVWLFRSHWWRQHWHNLPFFYSFLMCIHLRYTCFKQCITLYGWMFKCFYRCCCLHSFFLFASTMKSNISIVHSFIHLHAWYQIEIPTHESSASHSWSIQIYRHSVVCVVMMNVRHVPQVFKVVACVIHCDVANGYCLIMLYACNTQKIRHL